MKKNVLTTPKDKLLNLAVGAGIPFGTAASGTAGGCTGIRGLVRELAKALLGNLGGFALAAWLCGNVYFKRRRKSLTADGKPQSAQP